MISMPHRVPVATAAVWGLGSFVLCFHMKVPIGRIPGASFMYLLICIRQVAREGC